MTWFRDLSTTGKSLSALGAMFIAGLVWYASFGDHLGLPAQVGVNVAHIVELRRTHAVLEDTVGDILCILTQPEGANPLDCVGL